jgi:O-antigen ligase
MGWLQAIPWFCIPLFPAFITLTAVTIPGVSLIPLWITVTLLGAMAACFVLGTIQVLTPPRQVPPTLLPLLGLLIAGLLAAVLGFNPHAGLIFIGIIAAGILWHLAIVRFYRDPGVAVAIYWALMTSGLLASAIAIALVWLRWPAAQYTIAHGRAVGTFILPGELAGYLIIYLPIAYAVARATRVAGLRAVAWCGCAIGCVALVMTYSRTGWIALASAAAFYLFATRQRGQRRYAVAALLAGVLAVVLAFNVDHNPSENFTRISIWQAAGDIIARFPLTGVGPFDFASAYALVRRPDGDATAFHAHSFLLTIWAETGIVGVSAVLWTIWSFVGAFRERLAAATPFQRRLAIAVAAGLVGAFVQGLIDTVSVVIFGFWLPTMALALATARDGMGDAPE